MISRSRSDDKGRQPVAPRPLVFIVVMVLLLSLFFVTLLSILPVDFAARESLWNQRIKLAFTSFTVLDSRGSRINNSFQFSGMPPLKKLILIQLINDYTVYTRSCW